MELRKGVDLSVDDVFCLGDARTLGNEDDRYAVRQGFLRVVSDIEKGSMFTVALSRNLLVEAVFNGVIHHVQ